MIVKVISNVKTAIFNFEGAHHMDYYGTSVSLCLFGRKRGKNIKKKIILVLRNMGEQTMK